MTQKIAGVGAPYSYRPYWKGYDQQADEALADELLVGRTVRNASGRARTEFPKTGSPRETLARAALARLLTYYAGLQGIVIVGRLCSALMNDSESNRRIVFGFRKNGKRSDLAADYQLGVHVLTLAKDRGWPVEAAVREVMSKYSLSRKTVFEAYKRTKQKFRAMGN